MIETPQALRAVQGLPPRGPSRVRRVMDWLILLGGTSSLALALVATVVPSDPSQRQAELAQFSE